jgi:hypothetical protein
MPVLPTAQEAEAGEEQVGGQPGIRRQHSEIIMIITVIIMTLNCNELYNPIKRKSSSDHVNNYGTNNLYSRASEEQSLTHSHLPVVASITGMAGTQ